MCHVNSSKNEWNPISVYLVVAGEWVADKKCNFELGVPASYKKYIIANINYPVPRGGVSSLIGSEHKFRILIG